MLGEGLSLASAPEIGERFGFWHIARLLSADEAERVVRLARAICADAPLVRPTMRDGRPMRVEVTSAGAVGWLADRSGYRYAERHPSSAAWPAIPVGISMMAERALSAARRFGERLEPMAVADGFDTCLVNVYRPGGALGWHRDLTERDLTWPIVGISLGAAACFEIRLGHESVAAVLENGDAVVMARAARGAEHQIAEVLEPDLFACTGSMAHGTRVSLTLRRAR